MILAGWLDLGDGLVAVGWRGRGLSLGGFEEGLG